MRFLGHSPLVPGSTLRGQGMRLPCLSAWGCAWPLAGEQVTNFCLLTGPEGQSPAQPAAQPSLLLLDRHILLPADSARKP